MKDEFSFMELLDTPSISRVNYGNDDQSKPNEFCYWDDDYELWMENDEHLRERIKNSQKSAMKS